MKKLTCHCGSVEAEININGDLEKMLNVIVQFANVRERLCRWLKMKILKLPKEKIN